MTATLELTQQLMSCPSITPNDAGCQQIIAARLAKLGFHLEHLRFEEVDNLWARYGTASPLLVFAGHTDVVPPGPIEAWHADPFQPRIHEGFLYGRGAADMKSGLAAMIIAAENFIQLHPAFPGSIGFLITSDEEGPSLHGTKQVIEILKERNETIDYCIIGEASSEKTLGDQIRIGRRGSLHGTLTVHGIQGHVAYPHLAKNPIHECLNALQELATVVWDNGNESFPPTTFQVTNIHAGDGATNVIPGSLEVLFNLRFSDAVSLQALQERIAQILMSHKLDFDLKLKLSGHPFLTRQGRLLQASKQAIHDLTGIDTLLSTGGGTSDGRFIAPTGAEVIEIGPCNNSVHQANEHVRIEDLDQLSKIYQRVLSLTFFP